VFEGVEEIMKSSGDHQNGESEGSTSTQPRKAEAEDKAENKNKNENKNDEDGSGEDGSGGIWFERSSSTTSMAFSVLSLPVELFDSSFSFVTSSMSGSSAEANEISWSSRINPF
jgi:hypothetical protein